MRLIAVGDIHGHLAQLKALLEFVAPTQDDQVIFLGDYVDRGPDTPGVLDYLIEFSQKFPKTVFIGGNHDHLFINMLQYEEIIPAPQRKKSYQSIGEVPRFALGNPQIIFAQNGGNETFGQYGGNLENIPRAHIEFLSSCRLYHEVKVGRQTYLFVHAGVRPNIPIENQSPEDLLWLRDEFYFHGGESGNAYTDFGMGGKIIVHGHDPFLDVPGSQPFRICLDSGVGHDPAIFDDRGKLTCCDVLTRETWQVDSLLSKTHKTGNFKTDSEIPETNET